MLSIVEVPGSYNYVLDDSFDLSAREACCAWHGDVRRDRVTVSTWSGTVEPIRPGMASQGPV